MAAVKTAVACHPELAMSSFTDELKSHWAPQSRSIESCASGDVSGALPGAWHEESGEPGGDRLRPISGLL